MSNYLGETEINVNQHPTYGKYTAKEWALHYVFQYGQIDGAHHKQWVLDQVARILNDAPLTVTVAKWDNGHEEIRVRVGTNKAYEDWVYSYKDHDEDGEPQYDYDEGIAP